VMKLYTSAVYDLRICMEKDNPSPNMFLNRKRLLVFDSVCISYQV